MNVAYLLIIRKGMPDDTELWNSEV
jgi:hypothetical protein